jgi:hypothetical protein
VDLPFGDGAGKVCRWVDSTGDGLKGKLSG